jgi:predicted nucleic acid-binding protein
LSLYLDASVIFPTLVNGPPSAAVDRFLLASDAPLLISDFAAAEVASALSRLVRTGELGAADATARLASFDEWCASVELIDVEADDVRHAAAIVRRFDLMLRTPDALHVAITMRLSAELVTRDRRLGTAAGVLGVATALI